jgi:hypothetical protein
LRGKNNPLWRMLLQRGKEKLALAEIEAATKQ